MIIIKNLQILTDPQEQISLLRSLLDHMLVKVDRYPYEDVTLENAELVEDFNTFLRGEIDWIDNYGNIY